ncbi:sorting nexin-4-like isoform X2 [Ornithodoros turicata]|uniref:sorting nexin-4-like isoform X2 n=1 Tax=Ornithodoros turicata TaxID=34597 RepID=UPI003139260B
MSDEKAPDEAASEQPSPYKIEEINLTETERRCSGSAVPLQDIYVAYQVETVIREPKQTLYVVWRRYSDFECLRLHLQEGYPYVVIPPLPEKKVMYRWQRLPADRLDPDFVERRRVGLENFLRRLSNHNGLCAAQAFLLFLMKDASWRDSLVTAGLLQRADNALRSFSAYMRLKSPNTEFEEMKSYSSELQSSISNVLRIRAKLSDRTYGLHQLHQNYGRVLSEWSRLERGACGDSFQRAGQFMDKLAQCALPWLEEQEPVADRLKEYLFYTESLNAVCKHHDVLQYELEKKEALSTARETQKSQTSFEEVGEQGSSGLVSRLLSPTSTSASPDQQVQSLHGQIHLLSQEKQEFCEKARAEMKQFQEQKDADVREALILYVITQMKLCNDALSVWRSLHECFEKM